VRKALNRIESGCDLSDPDAVKGFIARLDVADSYKRNLYYAYEHYLKRAHRSDRPPRGMRN
jgi:hypothetical protein